MSNSETYRPYLLQRLEGDFDSKAPGIDGLVSCDYMGAAEYEFGAIPKCLMRMRESVERGDRYIIVEIDAQVKKGPHVNHNLMALVPFESYKRWGTDQFSEAVKALLDSEEKMSWRTKLKEPALWDREYVAWLDLKNDVVFSFSEVFLNLFHSVLSRPKDYAQTVDKSLHVGDRVCMAVILNGRSFRHTRGMRRICGKVAGVLEESLTIKDYKTYRMPYVYLITTAVFVYRLGAQQFVRQNSSLDEVEEKLKEADHFVETAVTLNLGEKTE